MPSLDNYSEKSRGMRNTLSCRETFQIILCEPALASLSLELSFGKFSCIASRPKHHNFKFHVLDFSIFPTKFFLFLMELTFYSLLCFLMSIRALVSRLSALSSGVLSVLNVYRSTFLLVFCCTSREGCCPQMLVLLSNRHPDGLHTHVLRLHKKGCMEFSIQTCPITEDGVSRT